MAKIGIFTFSYSLNNYGQVLQYLATQEFFKQRNHKPYLLVPRRLSLIKRLYISINNLLQEILGKKKEETTSDRWDKISRAMEKAHPRYFDKFRKEHFSIKECSSMDLSKGVYDAAVVGSDQTWAYISDLGFMNFEKGSTKKVALAPSLGQKVYSDSEKAFIKPLLEDFDIITCREDSGVDLCKCLGIKAELVLDPTFLQDSQYYSKYEVPIPLPDQDYVFIYLLGADTSVSISDIFDFAKERDLKVMYVASQGRDDDYEKVYPTVNQWLYLIKNAKYVITNSFHGMALSIIYRKTYMALPITGETKGMNERIYSLSSRLKLSDRIMKNDVGEVLLPVDFSYANRVITENKELINKLFTSIGL